MTASELLRLVEGAKGSLFAMYKLLADESGLTASEKVCVVTGFVGSVEQWDAFIIGWKSVLGQFEVPVFHGLDFWDWHLDTATGKVIREKPYEGWTDEDDFAFIDALLKVIEDAKLVKVGAAIVIKYFFDLAEDERRWLTTSAMYSRDWGQKGKPNDPWFAAFQSAILSSGEVVPTGDKLYPIFEIRDSPTRKKQSAHDKAREIYNEILNIAPPVQVRDRLGESIVFGSKEEHLGLQAADLLANRSRAYIVEGLGDHKLAQRLRDFLKKESGYTHMFGIRGLDLLLRGCPFRSTFWKTNDFKTAEPDYLERMRASGTNVVAYRGTRTGVYDSHHIRVEKVRRLKRLGVSGDLVYISSPDNSIQPTTNQRSDKEK